MCFDNLEANNTEISNKSFVKNKQPHSSYYEEIGNKININDKDVPIIEEIEEHDEKNTKMHRQNYVFVYLIKK